MLSRKKRYIQVALNSTLTDAKHIINRIPLSDRILIEAGTPLIKQFGAEAISEIKSYWNARTYFSHERITPYVVADLKCMDRGETEVTIASDAGADAAIVLGLAPIETIDVFIEQCKLKNMDSMVDMMNAKEPYKILRQLKTLPDVVILHRGVDEEKYSDKMLPIHLINKVKGAYDVLISIAGGDKPREIQSSIFNGADIVVLWKDFYSQDGDIQTIVEDFLKNIK